MINESARSVGAATSRRTLIKAALAAPVAACDVFAPSWSLEYRLKVYIAARGRTFTGQSSLKTVYHRVSQSALDQTLVFRASAWGEAVPIQLGSNTFLLGLLDTLETLSSSHAFAPIGERTFTDVLGARSREAFESGELLTELSRLRGEVDLPTRSWPLFAYFEDIADKQSGRFFELPGNQYRFAGPTQWLSGASLGIDVNRVTLEFGIRPTSTAIQRVAPWVENLAGAQPGRFHMPRASAPFVDRIVYRNVRMQGYSI